MRKLFVPILAIVAVFVIAGCSTKFNIAAPYKNITVIYGLLDEADPVHYVRIEKAFLSQNQSAITMAKVADSSFYPLLDVRIKRLDYSMNVVDTIHLTKVDLDTVAGYQKVKGVFFTTPNYAYAFSNTLDPNYIYQIMVTNPATGETDSAQAPIIDDKNYEGVYPNSFNVDAIDDTAINRYGLDFSESGSNRNYVVNIIYYPESNFSFEGYTTPAFLSDIVIRFYWDDSNGVSHQKVADSFDYDAGYQYLSNNTTQYQMSHSSFYSAFAGGMQPAPANTYRLMGRVGLYVYLATSDYSTYYQSSISAGLGITGGEIEPIFTNVQGANALGLFTSHAYRYSLTTLSSATIDSLGTNPVTQPEMIVGTLY